MKNLVLLFCSMSVFAGEGPGHSHGSELSAGGMQILGIVIIVILAGGIFFALSKRKK